MFTAIWLGDLALADALAAGRLEVEGAADLSRTAGEAEDPEESSPNESSWSTR